MNIEIRADRYEEEQKLARASYLLDQFVIEQEDYDFLKNYDKSLIKGFLKDPLYKAVADTEVLISEGGDFHSELVGYQYINNSCELSILRNLVK